MHVFTSIYIDHNCVITKSKEKNISQYIIIGFLQWLCVLVYRSENIMDALLSFMCYQHRVWC